MTEAKKRILLLGNGINNLENNDKTSWENLIISEMSSEQKGKFCDENQRLKKDVPFPLLYEVLNNQKNKDFQFLKNMTKSNLISLIWKKYDIVLTTNFTDELELTDIGIWENGNKSETKYNLHRTRKCANKTIWYIHGYLGRPKSVILGFSDYTEQAAEIRTYFGKTNEKKNDLWVNFFITHDIDIVGFSFDYYESDLWYVLSERKKKSPEPQNKIRYFDLPISNKNSQKFTKKQIFQQMKVEFIEIPNFSDYNSDYYKKIFSEKY